MTGEGAVLSTDYTIRMARPEDAERIIEIGSHSIAIGPYRNDLVDNPQVTLRLYKLLIDNPQSRIIVSEAAGGIVTGLFALIIFPHYYSGEITAGEIIWYVEPAYRVGGVGLALLREAERLAREAGAVRMQLTAPTEALSAMYKRCGYHQIEVSFQRKL